MTIDQERRAAEVLPRCTSLSQAEEILGGEFQGEMQRDYYKAARTWGMFDGFKGRPETHSGLPVQHAQEYHHAFAVGRRLSMAELPG